MFLRKKKDKGQKEKQSAQSRDFVRELCGSNEELYNAMSYALLLSPERLLELRSIDALSKSADDAKKGGDQTRARISYETAAKLALWKGQPSVARDYFKKALDVSESQQRKTIFDTVLHQMDEVARLAAKYYETKPSIG